MLLHPPPIHFLKCSLKFHYNAPQGDERYCDACGEDVFGFVYQCSHKHPHDYHPRCLKLPRTLTAGDGLILQLTKKVAVEVLKMWKEGNFEQNPRLVLCFFPLIDTVTI
ncbi:hypothetical protein OIU85_006551 [Salix viminalis]|uniref:DC1 domain-containing protein n=1 Tax=Salix viminalis TaxID=40686 RepID=A0A9Q0SUL4_SALVM|nr:hypothetical protein OIU85_006551 [Salix viminalis]